MNHCEHIADHQLLADFVGGNQESFRLLVERYVALVAAACRRELRSAPDLVDDATQACFLVWPTKQPSFAPTRATPRWVRLHRTARFAAANIRRKEQRRARYEHEAGREMSEQLRLHVHDEGPFAGLEEHLDEALETLPVKTREAVIQHYLMGRPQREVAEALGCSEEAAKKRIQYGVKKLRDQLSRHRANLSVAVVIGFLGAQQAPAVEPSDRFMLPSAVASCSAMRCGNFSSVQ